LGTSKTDAGTEGIGITLWRGAELVRLIADLLVPLLIGRAARHAQALCERVYRHTIHLGQRGLVMRAWSTIDITLRDIKGKPLGEMFRPDTELNKLLELQIAPGMPESGRFVPPSRPGLGMRFDWNAVDAAGIR
jgi:L-alanine-DL-glutamate epimerase-like enolase superfamily enzyme